MTMTDVTGPPVDPAKIEAFAGHLLGAYSGGMVTLMIDLAHRTGLLETLAAGPGTTEQLAARAELTERYVRECLGGLVTGGIVDYDPQTGRHALSPERALCLTGEGSLNMAPFAQMTSLLGKYVGGVAAATRDGGGVPYEEFRPEFTTVMDQMSRGLLDTQLIDGILPIAGDLPARLNTGIRVADVGCGTGHAINLMARAYPESTFVGYDIAVDAIAQASAEAAAWGLTNAGFEVLDVTTLPADPPFGAVFAFDAIHDQVDPAAVLDRIHAALTPDGVFVMMDVKAGSRLEDNIGNPLAPLLYATSTLHCTTVSLAHGGAGLGAMWGAELAQQMLADAGFVDVTVHDIPDDPFDSVYLAHKQ